MGVHAGVRFFDQRPVQEACRGLVEALQPHAPDGVSVAAAEGVALAHGACDIWTGERAARQPVRTRGGLVMVWDGRLDNRDDLTMRLDGVLAGGRDDASIALAAFERWGPEALQWLIGEWSLAVWDGRERTLHLARDTMGVRPLYYHADAEGVQWSSSLGELAVRTGRVDELDEAFVARFMALRFSTDVTPYLGIRGVPTASVVSFEAGRPERRRRYWRLEPGVIRYRDPRQYEEHLRALWTEAVGVRLRTEGTVWAELSGGLDSSSVVCMADALVRAGSVPAAGIQPISFATLESPEGDERRFIAEVERHTGRRSCVLGVEAHGGLTPDDDWVTPSGVRGVRLAAARLAHARGGRVMLSGRMGDLVMGCETDNSVAVVDDLGEGRILRSLAGIRLWSRACRKPFVEIVASLARHAGRGVLAPGVLPPDQPYEPGLALLHARLQALALTRSVPATLARGVPMSQRRLAGALLGYSLQARLEVGTEVGPVVFAYPFSHRPLINFVLSIPAGVLSGPGEPRVLMRRAFQRIVPGGILRRFSKGYYPPAATRATIATARLVDDLESLEVVQRSWIDPGRLASAFDSLTSGSHDVALAVQRALSLDAWLRSRHRRGPAAIPGRKEVKIDEVLNA